MLFKFKMFFSVAATLHWNMLWMNVEMNVKQIANTNTITYFVDRAAVVSDIAPRHNHQISRIVRLHKTEALFNKTCYVT